MKKQMIAVAVAAVFAAPMAMADVEVYGLAHVSVGQMDDNENDGSRISMLTNNSNVGFRGSEDLGGGLKAEYQAETALTWDTGGWGGGRDTFVGLGGDWGAVRVGRANSPFKNATASLDPFGDTAVDYNNIMGVSSEGNAHDTRLSNSIWYNSANLSGFAFQAMYQVNDRAGENTKSEPDAMSIGGTYKAGPIFVGAAWQSLGEAGREVTGGDGVDQDDEAWRIGASYTFKEATMIGLAYENVNAGKGDVVPDEKDMDRDALFVSLSHKIGATTLALSYADADKVADAADTSATQIAVGVTQALSKATSVYAIYGQLTGDASAPDGYKMAATTSTGSVTPSNDGSGDVEATALMLGITHKFSSK